MPEFESPHFDQWTIQKLAQYFESHVPEEERPQILPFLTAREIDGKRFAEMTEDEHLVFVDDFCRTTSAKERLVIGIRWKLELCRSELVSLASIKGFRRVPEFDFFYVPSKNDDWCEDRNQRPYYNPGGWQRYGIYPDKEDEDPLDQSLFNTWHVAYHGTYQRNVSSIIEKGLLPPGTKVDGVLIKSLHGAAGANGGKPIYCSPSIEYSSHWLYCQPPEVYNEDPERHEGSYVYTVFQVRVRPQSFTVQGNTLHDDIWGDRQVIFDRHFSNSELEWLVTDPNDIRVTGLMVRVSDTDPKKEVSDRFAKHQALMGRVRSPRGELRECLPKGQWEWNCAPSSGHTLSQNGPWQAYSPEEHALIEKAFVEWRTHVYLKDLNGKLGHCYYICFEAMEQRRTDNNHLRRSIRRLTTDD